MTHRAWEFVWIQKRVGMFEQQACGWVLEGLDHATPDTGWVVAHDVFHHAPGDTGTYLQEVATFGAETWFETGMDPVKLRRQLSTSWFSVMALVIENGTRGVEGLLLDGDTKADHPLAGLWREIYLEALGETQECFGEFADALPWEQLKAPAMVERAAHIAQSGYLRAQQQWPDLALARQWFAAVEQAAGDGVEGERLVVRIQDNRIAIERQLPGKRPTRSPGRP